MNRHPTSAPLAAALALATGLLSSNNTPAATVRAKDYATGGLGTDADPWVGWAAAFVADTEVVFDKGYFEAPVTAIVLPAGTVITGMDGAIVRWPSNRTSVDALFLVAEGTNNVVIRGLQFEPGTIVPADGVATQGGDAYIRIGAGGSTTTSSQITVEGCRFGIARYPSVGLGGAYDVWVRGSVTNLFIRDNSMDTAHTNVLFDTGHPSIQYIYKNVRIADNRFSYSQTRSYLGDVIKLGSDGAVYPVTAQFEDVAVLNNQFSNNNGTFEVTTHGDGLTFSNNTVVSANVDALCHIGPPSGLLIRNVVANGNNCVGLPNSGEPGTLTEGGSCHLKVAHSSDVVISGNSLRATNSTMGIDVVLSSNLVVSGNVVNGLKTTEPGAGSGHCFILGGSHAATFAANTCLNINGDAFFVFRPFGESNDNLTFVENQLVTTTGSPLARNFFNFFETASNVTIRGNRVLGANLTGQFVTGSPSVVNRHGNQEAVGETGWRLGGDIISDLTGDGLLATSGSLGIDPSVTKDSEWDTAVEINSRTVDDDFLLGSDATVTRDTEWDTAAEINARTTDDDFLTPGNSFSVANKDLSSTTNVFPATSASVFTALNPPGVAATQYCAPNSTLCGIASAAVGLAFPRQTFSKLQCKASVPPGSGKSWTVTLMEGSLPTSLTCSISSSATSCGDNTHFVTLVSGTEVSMRFVRAGNPPTGSAVAVACAVSAGP